MLVGITVSAGVCWINSFCRNSLIARHLHTETFWLLHKLLCFAYYCAA